jgi:hypothetical protein
MTLNVTNLCNLEVSSRLHSRQVVIYKECEVRGSHRHRSSSILTAVTIQIQIFSEVTPCRLLNNYRHFSICSAVYMKALYSFGTSVTIHQSTRYNIPYELDLRKNVLHWNCSPTYNCSLSLYEFPLIQLQWSVGCHWQAESSQQTSHLIRSLKLHCNIIIPLLLSTSLSPHPDDCINPDQAAHYHILDL